MIDLRIEEQLVDVLHLLDLQAIGHEHAREIAQRPADDDVAAGRCLRIRVVVANLALEQVDAGVDRTIEQERLAERQLVVLDLRAGQDREGDAFAAAKEVRRLERELAEEPLEL